MSGLAELASVMIGGAQRRVEVTADNISNMSSPGFKASRVFSSILDTRDAMPHDRVVAASPRATALKTTGNPLDLATDPCSVLLLRLGALLYPTRSAQLRRDADGHLVDGRGAVLQAAGGGDLSIGAGQPRIDADGTILIDGQPQARIGLYSDSGAATGRMPGEIANASRLRELLDSAAGGVLHQGMVVAADVDLAAEMVELTRAGRLAETGARVFQVYDDLLGKAASKLTESIA